MALNVNIIKKIYLYINIFEVNKIKDVFSHFKPNYGIIQDGIMYCKFTSLLLLTVNTLLRKSKWGIKFCT